MPKIYDISIPIVSGGVVYAGNPPIAITPQQEIAKGASANVSRIDFGSHTGTHVDAPRHFFDDAPGVDEIPLAKLMGPAKLITLPDDVLAVTEADLRRYDLRGQKRVLIHTRNSKLQSRGEFVSDYTYLAPDGAAYLVALGVELVGIDYYSIEQFHSGHHRTHRTLLEARVVIVEGLALAEPPDGMYDLIVLPLRLVGLDGGPARAVLVAQ